ncbi:MAG: PHP domain-containing protein, partial [Deltaproteobacteria bacterium]|nr:PHP domain-containing protein [Deltaproteobacteria bacterium]
MSAYVPLWCKSNFSFLEGASHPEELVEEAHRLGLGSLALTDRDGVYGVVGAHQKASKLGIHLIIGSEITINDGSTIVLLATDRIGYANLCRLISAGRLNSPKGSASVSWRQICEHADKLLALWGGRNSLLIAEDEPMTMIGDLKDAFGDRLYGMLARHQHAEECPLEKRLEERARCHGLPLVAAVEVLYHSTARRPLQDVLTCIRHRTNLAQAARRTRPNAEHFLKSEHLFHSIFSDREGCASRTLEIASRCSFSLDHIRYRYPVERLPDGSTSAQWLRHLAFEGAKQRYNDQIPGAVRKQ